MRNINRYGVLSVTLAGLAGLAGNVAAQWQGPPTVLDPDLFVWGEAPPVWADNLIHRTAHINIFWGTTVRGAHREFGSLAANGPEWAAESVIRNIVLAKLKAQ